MSNPNEMSESQFWKIVDGLGWGTRTTDYDAIKQLLMQRLSAQQSEEMRTTFARLREQLRGAMTDRAAGMSIDMWNLGDDSFDDLISHIIGLGQREYERVLRDPQRAMPRARLGAHGPRSGFTESFSYVIPWEEDYEVS